jgi:limonene-1,2-epoxide hydrolase
LTEAPSTTAVGDVVIGMWQALSRRDWEAIKPFLGADCRYVDMPIPAMAARGPDNIVKRLKALLEALPRFEGHEGLLVSNGSDAMYEHSETWTFPTGEQGLVKVVTVHRVVDGKITVWKDYWDMAGFMAFAPASYFEGFGAGDTSWVFDATDLV